MQKMILVSLLVVSVLMSFAKSMPYRKRDVHEMLADIPYVKGSGNSEEYYQHFSQYEQVADPIIDNSGSSNLRRKKISSLSITNPMDVLRQRFILELVRRRQMQQQEQAKANREILNDIGKRSAQRLRMIYSGIQMRNNHVSCQPIGQVSFNNADWNEMESLDWYDIGNAENRNHQADQSNRVSHSRADFSLGFLPDISLIRCHVDRVLQADPASWFS